jgi:hypothetical protein
MAYTYTIPLLLSSDTESGAFNVDTGNSKFDINFDQPIVVPSNAKNITVAVVNSSLWYTSSNISSTLANNKFYLDVDTDQVYTVTLANGLYDLSSFAHAVNVSLVNQGLASDIITFTADNSTQKVVINFSVAGLRIDFTGANNCREVLGFNSAVNPVAYTTAVTSIYGDSEALFNSVDYFLIHSNIVTGGIPINGKSTSVVARVLITASPGNQILFEPNQPTQIHAQHLAGASISRLHTWVTIQDGTTAPTFGANDNFSLELVITYQL